MSNPVVVITGAANGIGWIAAQEFARAGYKCFICDKDQAALSRRSGLSDDIVCLHCDVSVEAQVESFAESVESSTSGINCLISNVGVSGPTGPICSLQDSEWSETIQSNLTSHFYCLRHFHRLLQGSENASVLLTASVAGRFGYPLRAPYSASKWGTIGLAKTASREFLDQGIRVNAILPGIVSGERMDRVIHDKAALLGIPEKDVRSDLADRAGIRRLVEPEEVTAMMLFLASPAATAVSGQAISVCGDIIAL